MNNIKIILPGIYSSVQDDGRRGFRAFGMPLSGAMDNYAFRAANIITGNEEGAAAIEITGAGFECEFGNNAEICITGADLGAIRLENKESITIGKIVRVKKGEKIGFSEIKRGLRAYLQVSGGIIRSKSLGSMSMYKEERLIAGDIIEIGSKSGVVSKEKFNFDYIDKNGTYNIRVRSGFDVRSFQHRYIKKLYDYEFTVGSQYDRMGIRMNSAAGPSTFVRAFITKPVFPGCIQMPGNGEPIIIMNDGQTSGGYPVWAVVENEDLRIAAQIKAGDKVKFIRV